MASVFPPLLAGLLGAALATGESTLKLPDVDVVLGKASGKALDFAAQATEMQARLASKQKEHRAVMAGRKKTFETRLSEQAERNKHISDENAQIRSNIHNLEHNNSRVEKECLHLQAQNVEMRRIMASITEKVGVATSFLSDTLNVTDDTNAEELEILAPTTPKPTLEHFIRVAGSSDLGASLLQVRNGMTTKATAKVTAKVTSQERPALLAGDLVKVLSASLVDISAAEKEAMATLEASFLESFAMGENLTHSLLQKQAELNQTESQLLTRKAQLTSAKLHLLATRRQLTKRFRGLQVFASKVDQGAREALSSDLQEATSTTSPLSAATGDNGAVPLASAGTVHRRGLKVITAEPKDAKAAGGSKRVHPQDATLGHTPRGPLLRNTSYNGHSVEKVTSSTERKPDVPPHSEKPATNTSDSKEGGVRFKQAAGHKTKKAALSSEEHAEKSAVKSPATKRTHAQAVSWLQHSKGKLFSLVETGVIPHPPVKHKSWKSWFSSWR